MKSKRKKNYRIHQKLKNISFLFKEKKIIKANESSQSTNDTTNTQNAYTRVKENKNIIIFNLSDFVEQIKSNKTEKFN